MTTIAWDGRTLAADKKLSGGDAPNIGRKIWRLNDGRIVGAAGIAALCIIWKDWLEHGGDRPSSIGGEDYINGLEIALDGTPFFHGKYGRVPFEDKFCAIGTGECYAVATMALGFCAVKAIEIASRFDAETGAGIDILTLGQA